MRIHHFHSFWEGSYPKIIINQTQPMHICKSIAGCKEGKSLGLRIETVQTTVFRTNPKNTLIILAKLTYSFSMQTIICSFRIIFFEIRIKTGIVVHTAKVRTNPNATLTILAQWINSIIGQRIRIIDRTAQMNIFGRPEIINVKSRLCTNPQFIVRSNQQFTTKNRLSTFILRKQVMQFVGSQVQFFHSSF